MFALAATAVLIAGVFLVVSLDGNRVTTKPKPSPAIGASDAEVYAKELVLKCLKFPDNATFHVAGRNVEKLTLGPNVYLVTGKIKTMNAFGAKPILRYAAQVEYHNDRWKCYKLHLGDEVILDEPYTREFIRVPAKR